MGAVSAHGDGVGEPLPRSSRATDPLLVVEALGRHVAQHDGAERPDVDADLHGRRHAEHIDAMAQVALGRRLEQRAFEAALTTPLLPDGLRLPCELLHPHPARLLRRQPAVVVVVAAIAVDGSQPARMAGGIRADPRGRVNVDSRTIPAPQYGRPAFDQADGEGGTCAARG